MKSDSTTVIKKHGVLGGRNLQGWMTRLASNCYYFLEEVDGINDKLKDYLSDTEVSR